MGPILNTFSIAGELTGNIAGFSTRAFSVSSFVPVKYSILPLACTTSHFGDAWVAPNWKLFFWSWEVNFRARHSFVILRCFILCLTLNPARASLFVHHWPPVSLLSAGVSDSCRLISLTCRIVLFLFLLLTKVWNLWHRKEFYTYIVLYIFMSFIHLYWST